MPRIPNLPFFYLVFRAWSHWRALSGSKHIEFLLDNKVLKLQPSEILDNIYSARYKPSEAVSEKSTDTASPEDTQAASEKLVLQSSDGKRIAEVLKVPELHVELERAVWQVQKALDAEKELKEKETELDSELLKTKDRT